MNKRDHFVESGSERGGLREIVVEHWLAVYGAPLPSAPRQNSWESGNAVKGTGISAVRGSNLSKKLTGIRHGRACRT